MTNKTTKGYAILAIVPLLLAGFGGNAYAIPQSTSYSAEVVDDVLYELKPYVTVNDKKIAKLDVFKAMKNGISNGSIIIGFEFIKMQNKMIQDIHDNPDAKMKIDKKDIDKFKKFFEKAQKGELKKRNAIKFLSFLDFILPTVLAEDVCGGSEDNPHPKATYTVTGSYDTFQDGKAALSSGYSQVPGYASENSGYDFADWVTAYGCADGVFRDQTIIYDLDNDGDWQHHSHNNPSEPNPEVLGYYWPVYWWSGYTYWWHDNF